MLVIILTPDIENVTNISSDCANLFMFRVKLTTRTQILARFTLAKFLW